MSLEYPMSSYELTRNGESRGFDKMVKGRKVTKNEEEFIVPDPSLYVTRVISPEEEVRRRIKAKELSEVLKLQMQQKKDREAKEKKERILKELEDEERFNSQFKEAEKRTGRARVDINEISHPSLPKPSTEPPNKPFDKIEEGEMSFEGKYGVGERELYEGFDNYKKQALPVVSEVPLEIEYRIPHYDNELERLQRELHEKNLEFNNTLNKLKDDFFNVGNSKKNIEQEINAVKNYIKRGYHSCFDTLKTSSYSQLPSAHKKSEQGMGRYSKLYFTTYKPLSSKEKYNKTTQILKPLAGDSCLISWKEIPERKKLVTQTINKDQYNTLDDLINGFLSDIKTKTAKDKEPVEKTVGNKEVDTEDEKVSNDSEVLSEALDIGINNIVNAMH